MATTKMSMAGMPNVHTAGIYSDMTVDGPEIGDLIVIVDKAKNLPNRKTMGKQDPYCAARLGKEAKKTETDKRGGQTPRWYVPLESDNLLTDDYFRDQELRFTVHDSPDYHQLKVSVFNDDKRTDLIGETWVNLDNVLLRGGGRSDGWHSLNCKGRYAGEIRMELTYYDTRPKEEQPISRRRESAKNGQEPAIRESLSGPRQLKPVTRRPLPANPINGSPVNVTDHAHPTVHRPGPPRTYDSAPSQLSHPITHSRESPTPHGPSHLKRELTQPVPTGRSSSGMELPYQHRTSEVMPIPAAQHDPRLEQYGHHGLPGIEDPIPNTFSGRSQDTPEVITAPQPDYSSYAREPPQCLPSYSQKQVSHTVEGYVIPPLDTNGGKNLSRTAQAPLSSSPGELYAARPAQPAPSIKHHHSAPDYGKMDSHPTHYQGYDNPYVPRQSEESPYGQAPGPPRYRSHDGEYPMEGDNSRGPIPEDVPPPPPVHRVSESHRTLGDSPAPTAYTLAQPSIPADIENNRGAGLADTPNTYQPRQNVYPAPLSTTSGRDHPRTNPIGPSTAMYDQPSPQHLMGAKTTPNREQHHALPPSLVPGYDPRDATVETDLPRSESGSYVEPQEFNDHSTSADTTSHPRHHGSHSDLSHVASGRPHDAGIQRAHGVPVPLVKPIAVIPESVRVPRKSISPQPAATPENRRLSEVPFSPDAYNAFNPNVGSSSIKKPGPQYHTPEQASEVSRQRQREAQRGSADEPIIGWDGRVIDPSDHLPSDTWAPEPERKTPVKTPSQSEVRSRPSPQGAQPMPPSSRRLVRPGGSRPHSISTPLHIQTGEPHTPSSPSRNRLQKRIQLPASSPNVQSSPVGPYGSNHSTPRSLPRSMTTDLAPREHENYGYDRSPPYLPYGNDMKNSPMGTPPTPAKVPIRNGPDDYSALSEELSTIDIGSGRGRAARRIQY